ncbi:hypothetical protein, partial [Capnocytophaga stomatis]|uniref:hypothetical protein n=1 Tax=Capnocytophaga stomatis TaxID=1848904 RepID=UPI001951EE01
FDYLVKIFFQGMMINNYLIFGSIILFEVLKEMKIRKICSEKDKFQNRKTSRRKKVIKNF